MSLGGLLQKDVHRLGGACTPFGVRDWTMVSQLRGQHDAEERAASVPSAGAFSELSLAEIFSMLMVSAFAP